jgi:hypothetical protein
MITRRVGTAEPNQYLFVHDHEEVGRGGGAAMSELATGRRSARPAGRRLVLALLIGVVVGLAVALVAAKHKPDYSFSMFGSPQHAYRVKAWIATAVLALAVAQLIGALWIYGKLPGLRAAPRPVGLLHRANGVLLFALTVPVAVHCIVAYGFQTANTRVAVHSFAGCFFYGALAAKVVVVRSRRLPGWALPTAGGLLLMAIVALWYTAAVWFFNGYKLPFA